jgi:vacuolar-type H+-ATPase subunit F/Vma7
MGRILAMGAAPFVRQMELGGATGRVVPRAEAAGALEKALSENDWTLILLETQLVGELPSDVYERAFSGLQPVVIAVGGSMNEVLRRRIREVVGADLLSTRVSR